MKYPTKVRKSKVVPWGYKVSSYDKQLLEPIEEQLDALEEAKGHLKTCSYEQVAKWLSVKTGRSISRVGLFLKLKDERKRQRAEKRAATQA